MSVQSPPVSHRSCFSSNNVFSEIEAQAEIVAQKSDQKHKGPLCFKSLASVQDTLEEGQNNSGPGQARIK
jgi:hypothetical protein